MDSINRKLLRWQKQCETEIKDLSAERKRLKKMLARVEKIRAKARRRTS